MTVGWPRAVSVAGGQGDRGQTRQETPERSAGAGMD